MTRFPDPLESYLRQLRLNPRRVLGVLAFAAVAVVALVFFLTSWFTIQPDEKGVILRFGKYDRTVDPGLHYKLPFGVDQVYKVPVKRQLKQEFGFRTVQPGIRTEYSTKDYAKESEMLTGDLNVANVEWVTQYRVSDPRNYLFKVRGLDQTFHDMNEAVMREVVGDRTINEVITTGRIAIENKAKTELQQLCKEYEMGVAVDQVILQDVNPPDPVKPAFNEVNQAQQERESLINKARQEYNKKIPKAKGDADKMIEEARGYAVQRVNEARGDAERFNALFVEYQKAPEVTQRRIYLETMGQIMTQVGRKIILDEGASGVLPLLNLNREEKKP